MRICSKKGTSDDSSKSSPESTEPFLRASFGLISLGGGGGALAESRFSRCICCTIARSRPASGRSTDSSLSSVCFTSSVVMRIECSCPREACNASYFCRSFSSDACSLASAAAASSPSRLTWPSLMASSSSLTRFNSASSPSRWPVSSPSSCFASAACDASAARDASCSSVRALCAACASSHAVWRASFSSTSCLRSSVTRESSFSCESLADADATFSLPSSVCMWSMVALACCRLSSDRLAASLASSTSRAFASTTALICAASQSRSHV
mmetsp:Transcript_31454/g.92638  ORF Transcript_31454/g.92638 Transcript_31454/m.92638 type:complete len:270 (-) Transcript_31454:1557-2366(-)